MALVFHPADDEHAPFPHRIQPIPETERKIRDPYSRRISRVIIPAQTFVICDLCDHWIMRFASGCDCEYNCHELGALLGELEAGRVSS